MKMNFKLGGFTLAEVLITLGIIGIVAALTIPTLMQKADERANIVALKKAYTVLSQAYKLAENENGTPDTWGLNDANSPEMMAKLIPFLKIDKNCTPNGYQAGCWPVGVSYMNMADSLNNSGGYGVIDDWGNSSVRLTDGTIVGGFPYTLSCKTQSGDSPALQNVCGRYLIDVNGSKKPNRLGKDLFEILLTKYGLIPAGTARQTDWPEFIYDCKGPDASGEGCAAWAIYNDNMDYLHCNDIDWNTKTKCN